MERGDSCSSRSFKEASPTPRPSSGRSPGGRARSSPGATGYLGSTSGIAPRRAQHHPRPLESEEAAQANSNRPEQSSWWGEASKAFGDDVTFHDCRDVDTAFGGGTDKAGFVQVIQGRTNNVAELRRAAIEMEDALHQERPDILGIVIAWHGDGGFTQAVYFESEDAARAASRPWPPASWGRSTASSWIQK